jgi:prepilin-type N-terminal cleavage/methylation domain-containing protein
MPRRRAISSGFSLVELLVVVGIVAVLVALLLPVLGRARAEANRVACMSNLRQLLQAQLMYANDSRGFLTYPNWGHDRQATDAVWPTGWLYSQGQLSDPLAPDDVKTGALFRYLQETRVYRCPLHPLDEASTATGTDRLTSYIMNGAVCGYGVVGHKAAQPVRWMPSWKITDWRNPSEQILWWEAEESGAGAGPVDEGGAAWNDGSSYPRENFLSRRHGRGACVGHFDGSAAWMDRIDYVAELQRSGPNRLYCDPHRADGGKSACGAT